MPDNKVARIRELNDAFRKDVPFPRLGKTLLTRGVNALRPHKVMQLFAHVREFDDFSADNDPYREHDFGSITFDGEKFYFKIDYYAKDDPDLGSEDPSDPTKTQRVMTVMLASEY